MWTYTLYSRGACEFVMRVVRRMSIYWSKINIVFNHCNYIYNSIRTYFHHLLERQKCRFYNFLYISFFVHLSRDGHLLAASYTNWINPHHPTHSLCIHGTLSVTISLITILSSIKIIFVSSYCIYSTYTRQGPEYELHFKNCLAIH